MAKFIYVSRDDGVVVDIPEKHLEMTLKNHPTWKVVGTVSNEQISNNGVSEAPVKEAPVNECPLCGFVAASLTGLATHKRTKHA